MIREHLKRSKKILVTGGAGFVGSALCKRLFSLGYEVTSLDNYFTGKIENHHQGVKYFTGHTRDINKIFNNISFDTVYHLGEYSRVEKSFEDPIGLVWDLNTAGTFSVLEFCRKNKSKIIYAGSSTKFSDGGNGQGLSPYAWSKSANTQLVKNYGDWYSLDFAITYFYNVYGDNEISEGPYSTVLGIFKKQWQNNLPLTVVRPGDQKRNFTHIDDIVDALVLVGDKGHGDEYGIGSDESFSITEVAKLFETDIVSMPERKGNRTGAEVMSEKTKQLGWKAEKDLKSYLQEYKTKNSAKTNKTKNKILVFSTTFYPEEGFCEKALHELVQKIPDIHFDIITTNLASKSISDESVKLPANVSVYRIGTNTKKDKTRLFKEGYVLAKKLSEENQYAFVWSIMASYGTYPAWKIKKELNIPLLISLGDQIIPHYLNIKYWLFKFLINGGDQVSTNSVFEENISRTSNLNWLNSLNKKGDTFSNAFRFAYNMTFSEIYKNKNK